MGIKVGIGIIGCGMISANHVRGYLALPERAQILAVCDVVKESAQKRVKSIITEAKKQAQEAAEAAKKAETAEEKEKLKAKEALLLEFSESDVKIFSDYKDMLKLPGLDAVSIATPPFAHEQPTVDAARSCAKNAIKQG